MNRELARAARGVAWGVLLAAGGAASAMAQVAPSGNTGALVAAAGGNPQLASTAAYVGALCPNLTPGTDLRLRCAAALSAAVNAPPLASNALNQITPQELLAQGGVVDGAVAPVSSAVAGRLTALGRIGGIGAVAMVNRPILLASNGDTAGLGGVADRSRFQAFANVVGGSGSQDTTTYVTGYDFDQRSVTAGGDYRFSEAFTGGAALSYGDTKLNFDLRQGSMKAKATAVSVYGLWTASDRVQVTSYLVYSHIKDVSDRSITYAESAVSTISRIAHGETHGNQWEGTVTASYAMNATGGWSMGPSLGVSWRSLHLHAFQETGANGLNLSYAKQSTDSLQVLLGFDVSRAFSTSAGIVSPYARIQGVYETLDNRRVVNIHYVADTTGFFPGIRLTTAAPDRTRALLGAGVAGQFAGGWSAFVDGETTVGLRQVSNFTWTLGVRKEF